MREIKYFGSDTKELIDIVNTLTSFQKDHGVKDQDVLLTLSGKVSDVYDHNDGNNIFVEMNDTYLFVRGIFCHDQFTPDFTSLNLHDRVILTGVLKGLPAFESPALDDKEFSKSWFVLDNCRLVAS